MEGVTKVLGSCRRRPNGDQDEPDFPFLCPRLVFEPRRVPNIITMEIKSQLLSEVV